MKAIVLMSIVFVMSAQPMSLVIMMMGVVFVYSLCMYNCSGTFWYSIILMLVMLSGVMVVFTYMASMSPNESFELTISGVMLIVLMSYESVGGWEEGFTFFGMELWNEIIMIVSEFMVMFLLVIMLMSVWLSGWWSGPVRV